jgi:hypothetical protein
MLDDVADVAPVATVAKPVPRSPDTKAALRYLACSGANAISITKGIGGVVIAVGYKADAVAIFWLPSDKARGVAARARKLAGGSRDVESVIAALREAATQCRATLTEHDTAMVRANAMAKRLDAFMSSMTGTGVLREFNRTYKARRQAAFARGERFMKYKVALARLRSAMVPILMNGGQAVIGQSIFAAIFDN